jgi:tetratricopeptide (TPR) repeat protein
MQDQGRGSQYYPGVMLSSTFEDLKEHRAAMREALLGAGLFPEGMENNTAQAGVDVVESSLKMVRRAKAYVLVIGFRYGQTPRADGLSITEIEYNEALRLNLPVLLFLMSPNHLLHAADIEADPEKRRKLDAFRERAKKKDPASPVERVYDEFNSLEEFRRKATQAAEKLAQTLQSAPPVAPADPIPAPPALYAEPPYIGTHPRLVGRRAQLDELDDWARPDDPYPVLLFDAIGGSGKSMLTWHWVNHHARKVRPRWAGIFWYSFYEHGAVLADFCRRALAYITREPLADLQRQKTPELAAKLLPLLRARPWLLVLDGLERILVHYHRYDAAQLTEEEAENPTDSIAQRDPCSAIRPEDEDLLRALAGAAPSKILVSSRLVPSVLLGPAGQPISGVKRTPLGGLRPADAVEMFAQCGVHGNSEAIQSYLKQHCDCHPLVTGVLAGLILGYLPGRGNFDVWAVDPKAGGALNLADRDLKQKRNNILQFAIAALPDDSRKLLETLSLVPGAVEYPALCALSPTPNLSVTVPDLEKRGLLQYDRATRRYDLHPVVRGVVSGSLGPQQKETHGQRVVDYFSSAPHRPWPEAKTLEDVETGLHLVRVLLKLGRFQQACEAYCGDLSTALLSNLEANVEVLGLLRPFFSIGWSVLPDGVPEQAGAYLANDAAVALSSLGAQAEAAEAQAASLLSHLRREDWSNVCTLLGNFADAAVARTSLAGEDRCQELNLAGAEVAGNAANLLRARLDRYCQLARLGRWEEARAVRDLVGKTDIPVSRALMRSGYREYLDVVVHFWQGNLREKELADAERSLRTGMDRLAIRSLHWLRGEWHLERGELDRAKESLQEAVSMAREIGQADASSETWLALARLRLGRLPDARAEAERLSALPRKSRRALAELWLEVGDRDQSVRYALEAYERAWADGEPFVWRYDLNKSRALLERLQVPVPQLPPYDPSKRQKFPWEDEVEAAIARLKKSKAAAGR